MKIEPLKNGKFCLLADDGKQLGIFNSAEEAQKHYDSPNTSEPDQQPTLHNAKGFPDIFYARHMESGLCGYDNEKILVDADTMKKMAPSFAGKPVYVDHQDVNLKKLQEEADGYVADCFYNELDGWLWSKIIVVSDKGKKAVNNGWSVSNAYIPTMWSGGGSHHNVDYNRKMGEAEFTHLAIVPNPRYENAKIFTPEEYKNYCTAKRQQIEELRNSKRKKPMFEFWNKAKVSAEDATDESMVTLDDGRVMTVSELRVELKNAKKEESEASRLVREYNEIQNSKKAKKNADDNKEKDEREVEEDGEEKMNADEEAEYKRLSEKKNRMAKKNGESEKDEKKNSDGKPTAEELKAFEEMKNAKNKAEFAGPTVLVDLDVDQLARGKSRYGSTTK